MGFFALGAVRPSGFGRLDPAGLNHSGLGGLKAVVETVFIFVAIRCILQSQRGENRANRQNETGEECESHKGDLHGLRMPWFPKIRYPRTYVKDIGDSRRLSCSYESAK